METFCSFVINIPYLYTTWTTILMGGVVIAVASGVAVPCGLWRGIFSLFAGSCVAGSIIAYWHADTMALSATNIIFHMIPLIIIILGASWISSRVSPPNQWTSIMMFAVGLTVGLTYFAMFGTEMYPGTREVNFTLVVVSTLFFMIAISSMPSRTPRPKRAAPLQL